MYAAFGAVEWYESADSDAAIFAPLLFVPVEIGRVLDEGVYSTGSEDLIRRVPELPKKDLVTLSEIGALNSLGKGMHRRTTLWQVERAAWSAGPLLDMIPEQMELSPLERMTDEERLVADFHGSGMSTGPHPMTPNPTRKLSDSAWQCSSTQTSIGR